MGAGEGGGDGDAAAAVGVAEGRAVYAEDAGVSYVGSEVAVEGAVSIGGGGGCLCNLSFCLLLAVNLAVLDHRKGGMGTTHLTR